MDAAKSLKKSTNPSNSRQENPYRGKDRRQRSGRSATRNSTASHPYLANNDGRKTLQVKAYGAKGKQRGRDVSGLSSSLQSDKSQSRRGSLRGSSESG